MFAHPCDITEDDGDTRATTSWKVGQGDPLMRLKVQQGVA